MNQFVSWKQRAACGMTCGTVLAILAVLQTVSCTSWVVYGLLEQRVILVLPNLTGLLLGLIQIAVYIFSRNASRGEISGPEIRVSTVPAAGPEQCDGCLTPPPQARKRLQRSGSLSSSPSTSTMASSVSEEPYSPSVPSESSESPLPFDVPKIDLGPQTVDYRGMVRCSSQVLRSCNSLTMRRDRDESVRWVGES